MNENQQQILGLAKRKDISKMSYREICRELGIKYPQTVIHHINQLNKKGLLYFDAKKRQRVTEPKPFAVKNMFNIPLLGTANCGPAMELAQENIKRYVKVSQKSVNRSKPDGLIVIKAVGESLNKSNINGNNIEDGDYVIVDCAKQPINGDYVLSVIEDAANLKRFFRDLNEKGEEEIRLLSESTIEIPPIVIHEGDMKASGYSVNGVIIKVIKNSGNDKKTKT